jgi:replication factor C large subunit
MATARREVLPFLGALTHHCKPRELTVAMAAFYDFDESHVSFVTGSGETTNKVESIVADAAALRDEAMAEHAGNAFVPGRPDEDRERESAPDEDGAAGEGDDGQNQATLAATAGDDGTGEAGETAGEGPGSGSGSGTTATADDGDDGGEAAEDAEDESVDDRAEEAETDDGQSGLGDFF